MPEFDFDKAVSEAAYVRYDIEKVEVRIYFSDIYFVLKVDGARNLAVMINEACDKCLN